MTKSAVLKSLSAALALATTQTIVSAPALAAASKERTKPSGTLLLPLTPRIDDGTKPSVPPLSSYIAPANAAPAKPPVPAPIPVASRPAPVPAAVSAPAVPGLPAAPTGASTADDQQISAETGIENVPDEALIDENSLLKGTVQIVADDTEYDQEKNTFLGTGNAVAIIAGQDSKLEADTILYDQNNGTIDARGNVKIVRNGQLTTGGSFKFNINSDEYLITQPDTELQGTNVVARMAKGNRTGLTFKKGEFTMPQPIHIMNNAYFGPISTAEQVMDMHMHPDAYVPKKQSFKFKARKMVYERYKSDGNLTVFGGKIAFDHFTLPLPKFTANVGAENTRVVFPMTPLIGNNMMVGGVNLGPQFNYAVGKTGAFSWAPLLQIGGRSFGSDGTITNNTGKIGAGFKLGYSSDTLSAHVGYGSVSNLLVADLKYRVNKHAHFQAGINRFQNDGMFGMRRPGRIAEFVDNRGTGRVPYLSYLNFRTSAGWAQDNPALLGLSGSQYAKLFGSTSKSKTSAFRLQEQITATSHPLLAVGNAKYGADVNLTGGVALRAYSTGDSMIMAQAGPMLNVRMDRLRARAGYMQSSVGGQSPFVFDQFIQGNRSVYLQGDVKICKWLTLGTNLGYNLNSKLLYSRAITAAVGPDDFKFLFTRDTISGYQRFGFNVLYGQPVAFDKLTVKGAADAGQLAN